LLQRDVLERHYGTSDARVVEQQIETSETRLDLGEQRRHRFRIPNVAHKRDCLATGLCSGVLERLAPSPNQHDRESGPRQGASGRTTDAGSGAGDERNPSH
jgi:hypothetical protein